MTASESKDIVVDISGVNLKIDVQRTQRAYEGVTRECSCPQCRNFMAQIRETITPELATELKLAGVDPYKPTEITHAGPVKTGHVYFVNYHLYGVWSDSAQQALGPGQGQVQTLPVQMAGAWGHICEDGQPAPDVFTRPYMKLELHITTQWVIDDPEPK